MASVIGICNSALIKIGAQQITSLTEGSKNANHCGAQYDTLRRARLRAHVWNFAVARAKLAQAADPPVFEWDFAYALPADFLRAVSVHGDDSGRAAVPYKAEGGYLLASSAALYLRYVRDVTDPNLMDALFREVLAWALAAELAIPIANSVTTQQAAQDGLRAALSEAKSVDAIEDFPEAEPEGDWVTAREG